MVSSKPLDIVYIKTPLHSESEYCSVNWSKPDLVCSLICSLQLINLTVFQGKIEQRFNIDINSVVFYCKSQGGNLGHWAAVETEFPFKGVGLFAPSTDPYMQATGHLFYTKNTRDALVKYVPLDGTDAESTV